MPRPVYILCSQDGATDSGTGLVSHFSVIDGLEITAIVTPPAKPGSDAMVIIAAPLKLLLCAAWGRTKDDKPGDQFEMEVGFTRPGKDQQIMSVPNFTFEKNVHRLMARIDVKIEEEPQSGEFCFESRVRKLGSKTWLKQRYTIDVSVQANENLPVQKKSDGNKRRRVKK